MRRVIHRGPYSTYHAATTWPSHTISTFLPHSATYFNQLKFPCTECSSTTPILPHRLRYHLTRIANDIFASWVLCLLIHTKTLARPVSSARRRRRSHTLHVTLNQTQATHLPRFPSSEIAPRHSPIHHTNRRLRFRTQPLGLPGCLTSLPSSRTSARSQLHSGHYLVGKAAGRGICPSCVKERPWALVCTNILQELTFRPLPPRYVQV